MNTITSLFQQAQLAEAAYANFGAFSNPIDALTKGGKFSTAQATAFAARYQVVSQYTATGGLLGAGSGFSATLFLDTTTGQYTFAARGTQPGYTDLAADIGDIVADGIAIGQVIDLYNYWKSLTSNTAFYQAAYLDTLATETLTLKALWAQTVLPGSPASYANYVAQLHSAGILVNMGLDGPTAQQVMFGDSNFVLPGSYISIGLGYLSHTAVVGVAGQDNRGHRTIGDRPRFYNNSPCFSSETGLLLGLPACPRLARLPSAASISR